MRAIVTAPEPGLYGLDCATFTQRFHAVAATVDRHVEDVNRLVHLSSY